MPHGPSPLAGRTVLAVFAHPDDESLACGGTLARLADAGARVALVCATHGEKGSVSDPDLVLDSDLGRVRACELRNAAAVLGIRDIVLLDHPDGEVRWAQVASFHAEIVMAIERFQPDAVITFAEDGLYWHLDHVGVYERTTTAVRSLRDSAPPLYYVTMSKGVMNEIVASARDRSGAPADFSLWGIEPDAFGDHAVAPDFVVDVSPWVPRKLAALRCHRSQIGPRNPFSWLDEVYAQRWLGVEQFRRARINVGGPALLEQLGDRVAP